MVDLDQQALASRGLSPSDVASAISQQNVILPPSETSRSHQRLSLAVNNSPDAIATIGEFPVKDVAGKSCSCRDIAHVTMDSNTRPIR